MASFAAAIDKARALKLSNEIFYFLRHGYSGEYSVA